MGAVGEGIAVAAVARVADLGQALLAGGEIGQDRGAARAGQRAVADGEAGSPLGGSAALDSGDRGGRRRRAPGRAATSVRDRRSRAFRLEGDALRRVDDIAGEAARASPRARRTGGSRRPARRRGPRCRTRSRGDRWARASAAFTAASRPRRPAAGRPTACGSLMSSERTQRRCAAPSAMVPAAAALEMLGEMAGAHVAERAEPDRDADHAPRLLGFAPSSRIWRIRSAIRACSCMAQTASRASRRALRHRPASTASATGRRQPGAKIEAPASIAKTMQRSGKRAERARELDRIRRGRWRATTWRTSAAATAPATASRRWIVPGVAPERPASTMITWSRLAEEVEELAGLAVGFDHLTSAGSARAAVPATTRPTASSPRSGWPMPTMRRSRRAHPCPQPRSMRRSRKWVAQEMQGS